MKIFQGPRIAKGAIITVGAAGVVFDESHQKILLTQRSDNHRWCLPGGHMDSGESAAETCIREVLEETGLNVEIVKLIGIYTSPDVAIQHGDGPMKQLVSMCFECRVLKGTPGLSNETTAVGWYAPEEIERLDLIEIHRQRIEDAITEQARAFVR